MRFQSAFARRWKFPGAASLLSHISAEARMLSALIIDSDPVVRLTAARVLSNAGYVVMGARSLQDALSLLDSLKADIAICDVTEKESLHDFSHVDPEMSVLGMIRNDKPAFQAHNATLRKPFTASELLSAARRCLARRG